MFIFPNVYKKNYLKKYQDFIYESYNSVLKYNPNLWDEWTAKAIKINNNEEIVHSTKIYLEKFLKIDLKVVEIQGQVWPPNSRATGFHKHSEDNLEGGRGKLTLYNSILYLNDDFEGGEFKTEYGVTLTPQPGMLTFFNGRDIMHCVSPVRENFRFTIIFWWDKDSDFSCSA